MRLRLVKEPFDHPDYIFELKHDGFRAVVYIQNGECKILSRNSNQLRFKSLRANLAKLPALDAILDGEIVCLDEHGASRFNDLLNKKTQPVFYAFDLLWLNGEDLRQQLQGDMCARSGRHRRQAQTGDLQGRRHWVVEDQESLVFAGRGKA